MNIDKLLKKIPTKKFFIAPYGKDKKLSEFVNINNWLCIQIYNNILQISSRYLEVHKHELTYVTCDMGLQIYIKFQEIYEKWKIINIINTFLGTDSSISITIYLNNKLNINKYVSKSKLIVCLSKILQLCSEIKINKNSNLMMKVPYLNNPLETNINIQELKKDDIKIIKTIRPTQLLLFMLQKYFEKQNDIYKNLCITYSVMNTDTPAKIFKYSEWPLDFQIYPHLFFHCILLKIDLFNRNNIIVDKLKYNIAKNILRKY